MPQDITDAKLGGTIHFAAGSTLTTEAGVVIDLSAATVKIPAFTGDTGQGGVSGAVPAPPAGSGANKMFLCARGDFEQADPLTTLGDVIYGGAGGVATRLAIGATGKVLTVAGGRPVWATPTGGTGGGTTADAKTDAFDGSALDPKWTVQNQGTATVTVSGGNLNISDTAQSSGDNLRLVTQPVPGTDFSIVVPVTLNGSNASSAQGGVVLYNSANGKLTTIDLVYVSGSSGFCPIVERWNGVSSHNSTEQINTGVVGANITFKVALVGTALTYSFSTDGGTTYTQLATENVADFLGGLTDFGLYASATLVSVSFACASFTVTTPADSSGGGSGGSSGGSSGTTLPTIIQQAFGRGGSATVALANPVTAGNLLLILCMGGGNAASTGQAGYVVLYSGSPSNAQGGFAEYRLADGTEGAPSYNFSGSDNINWAVFEISAPFNVIATAGAANTNGNTVLFPAPAVYQNSLRLVITEWDNTTNVSGVTGDGATLLQAWTTGGNHRGACASMTGTPLTQLVFATDSGADRPGFVSVEIAGT